MVKKRGLSSILSVLIIILLVLAAVGILWVPLQNFFQSANTISVSDFAVDMVIKAASVNETNFSSVVQVRKNPGVIGEVNVTALQFVFEDNFNSESYKAEVPGSSGIFERVFSFDLSASSLNVSEMRRVTIIPIYINSKGEEVLSRIPASSYDLKNGVLIKTPIISHLLSISISTNKRTYNQGENVIISASVYDSMNNITKVDFYEGTNLIGTDTSSPYSYSWDNVSGGTYSLTGKVTSGNGDGTTSLPVAINVISALCGDGNIDPGEECDLGTTNNGVVCVPPYAGSCTYCSFSCTNASVQGGFCGDGICQPQENS